MNMRLSKVRTYVSGPLTNLDVSIAKPLKEFYISIRDLCEELGFEAYVPHANGTDPVANPDIQPREVFRTDKDKVQSSDLIIAYVGLPSLGVGMELAYAESKSIPIILLFERAARVSRFVLGIPTVFDRVEFSDYDDALRQLRNVLIAFQSGSFG